MKIATGRLRLAVTLIAFTVTLTLATLATLGGQPVWAASDNSDTDVKEAQIIVQFDESDALIRPITFTGEISSLQALQLTGLDVVTADYGYGPAICAIEGVGCPADDCFCDASNSWGTSFWTGTAWEGYSVGAGSTVISQTGHVDGFRWGVWPSTPSPAPDIQAAQAGLDWLQERQSSVNGSYGNRPSPSLDVMLAIGANHLSADAWRRTPDSPSLQDYVAVAGAQYSQDGVAESGRLGAAMVGADGCWPPGAVAPSTYYSPALGSLSDQAGFLSWAILGTIAMSEPVPSTSVDTLLDMALPNGGWEWSPTWGADTNATAIAIQALAASGVPTTATQITDALAYLKSAQNDDGGFPYQPDSPFGTDSDTNSTSWVVQALWAVGEDPRSAEWSASGHSPIDFLLVMKASDGSFRYQAGFESDEFATRQAVQALLGSPLPMAIHGLVTCDLQSTMIPLVRSQGHGETK